MTVGRLPHCSDGLDYDAPDLDDLLRAIGRKEAEELMRSLGPLESRQRFKSLTGQPLQEKRVVEYLFLDESGRSDPRSPGSSLRWAESR